LDVYAFIGENMENFDREPSTVLPFEKPLIELDRKIAELEELDEAGNLTTIESLKKELEDLTRETISKLTPHQIVQLSRHPDRPQTSDYISMMITGFIELRGGRSFKDDKAIITGIGKLDDRSVMVIGHEKGKTTKDKVERFFGCAHPDGYRKAAHKAKLAEKYGLPIITFINTPGAFPGIDAEARGQAQAIAKSMFLFSRLKTPIVCIVIGEGGSGGALGIGVGDRLLMLENSYYSVISPEGCSAILWKSGDAAEEAAIALKLTARDLIKLGVIDEIIPEPLGGAHRNHMEMVEILKSTIHRHFDELDKLTPEKLIEERYHKLRQVGEFVEESSKKAGAPQV